MTVVEWSGVVDTRVLGRELVVKPIVGNGHHKAKNRINNLIKADGERDGQSEEATTTCNDEMAGDRERDKAQSV